jgi:hypothetical protein
VIHPSGDVYDDTYQVSTSKEAARVGFNSTGGYWYTSRIYSGNSCYYFINRPQMIFANTSSATGADMFRSSASAIGTPLLSLLGGGAWLLESAARVGDDYALGQTGGLSLIKNNTGNPAEGAVCDITSTYNTGYMVGDIRGAWLANARGSDRCVKDGALTINEASSGDTVDEDPVATGAELKGFSNFSSSNYLSRASDTNFDFGTGDFSIMFWVKGDASSSSQTVFQRGDSTPNEYIWMETLNSTSGVVIGKIHDGTTSKTITTSSAMLNGSWTQCAFLRRGANLEIYINGKSDATPVGSSAIDISDNDATIVIGNRLALHQPINASLSLFRISATAPTPQQIKEIYEAEKPLFAANAKCLLSQTSYTVVEDLAYDKTVDLLYAGTKSNNAGDSVSVFKGLERVSTIDGQDLGWDNATAHLVAAAGGAVGYVRNGSATGSGVILDLPALDVRAELNEGESKIPDDGKFHFEGVTTDATPTIIGQIPIGENESLNIKARFTGYTYQLPSSSKHIVGEIKQQLYRNLGSDVSEASEQSKLVEEGNAALDVDLGVVTASQTGKLTVTGYAGVRMVWTAEVEVQRISDKTYER